MVMLTRTLSALRQLKLTITDGRVFTEREERADDGNHVCDTLIHDAIVEE